MAEWNTPLINSTDKHLVIDKVIPITSDVTYGAGTAIQVLNGGGFSIAAGKTLTINGPFMAGSYKVFFGLGSVIGLGSCQIKWFGAMGDGITDDAVVINAAANAAGVGAAVYFTKSSDSYIIGSALRPLSNQHWIFEKGAVLKRKDNTGGFSIINVTSTNGVVITNPMIDGNDATATGKTNGILFNLASGGVVENPNILNCRYDPSNASAGVYILASDHIKVRGGKITNSNNNILLQGASYCDVSGVSLEDNYLSEAISIYGGNSGEWSNFNTISDITIKNANTGVNIQNGRFNTVTGVTIDNAVAPLAVMNTGNTISNFTIRQGDRSTTSHYGIAYRSQNEDTSNTALPYTIFSDISYDANGYQMPGLAVTSNGSAVARNAIFKNITLTDSTKAMGGNIVGVTVANAQDITFENLKVTRFSGIGFLQSSSYGVSKNIKVINPTIQENGKYGVYANTSAVVGLAVVGGEIKNNSQLSAGTYAGLFIDSLNYNVTSTAKIFDDQASPTQTTPVYSVSNGTSPYNGGTPPSIGFWKKGERVERYDVGLGNPTGAVCSNSSTSALATTVTAGGTAIVLASGISFSVGDNIGVQLDDGSYLWTTISATSDYTTHITLASAVPAGRTAPAGTPVNTWAWKTDSNSTPTFAAVNTSGASTGAITGVGMQNASSSTGANVNIRAAITTAGLGSNGNGIGAINFTRQSNGDVDFEVNTAPGGSAVPSQKLLIKGATGATQLGGATSFPLATSVASASAITPTGQIFHVTGTAAISTINSPFASGSSAGQIIIIPDAAFTMTTSGNIKVATTAIPNKPLTMTYDGTWWYPSY